MPHSLHAPTTPKVPLPHSLYASTMQNWAPSAATQSRAYDPNRLVVIENEFRLAMVSPHRGRIYSRWDKKKGEALSPYGHRTADLIYHGMPTNTSARVLMIGLGGGVIAGDLLCRDGRLSRGTRISGIDVVELNQSVVNLASSRFFPVMFSGDCAPYRSKLRVILGDAFAVTSLVPRPVAYDGIVVDIPPGYEEPDAAPLEFWSSLLAIAAPGALMVTNTLYAQRDGTDRLAERLGQAGWRALPAVLAMPMPSRAGAQRTWRPRANVLVPARPIARHPRRRHGLGVTN